MAYTTKTIRQFRGLSQNLALTAGDPSFATDCINVIPSVAGIAKLRVPETVSASAVGGNGPDQFAFTQNATTKAIIAFFGEDIYTFSLDDFTPTIIDTNPDYLGTTPWSVVLANNFAFIQNGKSIPLKWGGGAAFEFWGIQTAQIPTLGVPSGTGFSVATGRQYRAAYKNSVTGHVGAASLPSASTGVVTDDTVPVTIPGPAVPDGQIDTVRLYATLDGASDYFFHSEATGTFPIIINDDKQDIDLDQSERAPLINNDPPKARFLCRWGARIFMFNLVDENTKWCAYTGYNRIFIGRPEETCPPNNRIRLETGADDISGGGVIEAGVVVFDRADKAFMFRGQPEDITNDAPVEFSLFLKQLPWAIGCASHFTIQSTPYGLVWLTPTFDVRVFNGEGYPASISEGAEPLLRQINSSAIGNSRSVYWQYKDRDWYILAVATGNSSRLNQILIFDMEPNQEKNFGIFPFDLDEFDSIGIVEMTSGEQKIILGQDGLLKELKVTSTTVNGIEGPFTLDETNTDTLGAWWRGVPNGNESPTVDKFFRYGRVTSDSPVRVKRFLYKNDIRNSEVLEYQDVPTGGKIPTNRKGKRLAYELRFDDRDFPQNILELTDVYIPVADGR